MSDYILNFSKELGTKMRPQLNGLQRALMVAKSERGRDQRGAMLNTRGGALVRTVTSAREGLYNADRYRRVPQQRPKVKAEMSFAIDYSSSMIGGGWTGVTALCGALIPALQRMGVTVQAAAVDLGAAGRGCRWDNNYDARGKGTSDCVPVLYRIPTARWSDETTKKMGSCYPNSGTDLMCYAQAAWDMLRSSRATHKVGFYLTDGADSGSYPYLTSIEEQAAREGIILVGVAFGDWAKEIGENLPPRSIIAESADELGVTLVPHITSVIKRGV